MRKKKPNVYCDTCKIELIYLSETYNIAACNKCGAIFNLNFWLKLKRKSNK